MLISPSASPPALPRAKEAHEPKAHEPEAPPLRASVLATVYAGSTSRNFHVAQGATPFLSSLSYLEVLFRERLRFARFASLCSCSAFFYFAFSEQRASELFQPSPVQLVLIFRRFHHQSAVRCRGGSDYAPSSFDYFPALRFHFARGSALLALRFLCSCSRFIKISLSSGFRFARSSLTFMGSHLP